MSVVITERKNGSRRHSLKLDSESKVEQSHRDEVNINTIMAKVRRGGLAPIRRGSPMYGDFTNATDFQETHNRILEAHQQFMQLPAELRGLFDNQPANLIDFINDPDNLEEAIELGLIANPNEVADEPEKLTEPQAEAAPEAATVPDAEETNEK